MKENWVINASVGDDVITEQIRSKYLTIVLRYNSLENRVDEQLRILKDFASGESRYLIILVEDNSVSEIKIYFYKLSERLFEFTGFNDAKSIKVAKDEIIKFGMRNFAGITVDDIIEETKIYVKNQKVIYETLLYSYKTDVLDRVISGLGYPLSQREIFDAPNGIVYVIAFALSDDAKKQFKELNDKMTNFCNWRLAMVINKKLEQVPLDENFLETEEEYVFLRYEPKFDVEIQHDDVPKKLYHLTTKENLSSILRNGLTPKSKSRFFSYDDRIYLSDNVDRMITIGSKFASEGDKLIKSKVNKKGVVALNFVVLEIEIDPRVYRTRLFKDPNFKNGFFTMDNISPDKIKPILSIEFNEEGKLIKQEKI